MMKNTAMHDHAQRALACLEAEKALCGRMAALLEEEQTALTVMDMKKIIALGMEKDDIAGQVVRHDRVFRDEAAAVIGCAPEDATVSGLAARLEGSPMAARLAACGRELAALRERIAAVNEVNREFIRATLGFLGDAVAVLTGGGETPPVYGRGPSAPGRGRPPEMVSREI